MLSSRDDRIRAASQAPAPAGALLGSVGRGLASFNEAFEDALKVVEERRPREIRVRWHPRDDTYTWSIEY